MTNFTKEVKFADSDSSDTELSPDESTSHLTKTSEAIKELKHALRQSKCIIAGKFSKVKEKSDGL